MPALKHWKHTAWVAQMWSSRFGVVAIDCSLQSVSAAVVHQIQQAAGPGMGLPAPEIEHAVLLRPTELIGPGRQPEASPATASRARGTCRQLAKIHLHRPSPFESAHLV